MLSSIYKSTRKHDTYLYIEKAGDFSRVPDALMDTFGKPVLVMTLNLSKQKKLAGADIETVLSDLKEKGFYLQLSKSEEDMLAMHKAMQKADLELEKQNAADAAENAPKH
ncbi:YcgL domain-containing protein [Alteromonas sp. a30]|uniref:YcgL domain-containing protein n=1 Tax=Alteromonas sp. a30 TaxID=2730917 RepID=UPI0022817B4E|nr:YcgL domain-containing protein [Alteromonas sp. a30]MCY7296823.1 YcgL domain-containing protein [Alteromonas sp. a30]